MKTTTIFFLFVIVTNFLFGQTLTTEIKTPLGSIVPDTYYRGELIGDTQKAALSDSITLLYPNATEVNPPSATTHYNCHSYAWYRSEGGDKNVWMGLDYDTSEDIYWLDGSYIQINTINDGNKVSYAGNHSAIVLSGTNCRSKWGQWPLVDHPVGYGPYNYNMSQRTYYTTLRMDGPTILCESNNGTYSTPAYVNCTYNWTYDTSRLNYVSGQGTNNFQVIPKSPLVPGQAWVKLSLTINSPINKTREITKNIWVGSPAVPIFNRSSPFFASINSSYSVRIESPGADISTASWGSSGCVSLTSAFGDHASFLTCPVDGCGDIYVNTSNVCGYSNNSTLFVISGTGGDCMSIESLPPASLSLYPNPASTEATVEIYTEQSTTVKTNIEWYIEIYDKVQALKAKTQQIKGTRQTLNISGWQDGIYIIRAVVGDETLTGKLVVKH